MIPGFCLTDSSDRPVVTPPSLIRIDQTTP